MSRGNRLVELVEGLQQVVAILEGDRVTWSEEDFVDVVDHALPLIMGRRIPLLLKTGCESRSCREEVPLSPGKMTMVNQMRVSWNFLLCWLREAEAWGQAAGAVG